jgi:hypothetical protein
MYAWCKGSLIAMVDFNVDVDFNRLVNKETTTVTRCTYAVAIAAPRRRQNLSPTQAQDL